MPENESDNSDMPLKEDKLGLIEPEKMGQESTGNVNDDSAEVNVSDLKQRLADVYPTWQDEGEIPSINVDKLSSLNAKILDKTIDKIEIVLLKKNIKEV